MRIKDVYEFPINTRAKGHRLLALKVFEALTSKNTVKVEIHNSPSATTEPGNLNIQVVIWEEGK